MDGPLPAGIAGRLIHRPASDKPDADMQRFARVSRPVRPVWLQGRGRACALPAVGKNRRESDRARPVRGLAS